MRGPTAVAATIASGVLYALAFPTTSFHVLAWVALVPWLVVVRYGSAPRAIALAWLWSLVAAYGLNDWFPRAVSVFFLQPWWVGAVFFLGVTTCTAAPAFAAFVLCWRRLGRYSPAWSPLLAAAAWVVAEVARARVLGDPWALLGYSQVPVPALLQVADSAGVYGTSFVIAAANAALAEACNSRFPRRASGRAAWRGVALAAALAATIALYGMVRLSRLVRSSAGAVPVAVVQGNLALGSQWRSELYGQNLEAYLRLTIQALREIPTPRLIVWPESTLSFFLDDEPSYRAAIARVLAGSGAQLIVGGPRTANGSAAPFHNAAFLLNGDGDITAWYDKLRLLPFAESVPPLLAGLSRRSFGRVREFTAGVPSAPLPTVAGRAGVVVCNEALFAEPARERVLAGAQILVALANDSWVSEPKYAEQALQMTVVRAIEQRRPVLRASSAGPSAIIDPSGRIAARSTASAATALAGAVTPHDGLTLYARVGDLFAIACGLVTLWVWVRSR